jgi:hypothetical protein
MRWLHFANIWWMLAILLIAIFSYAEAHDPKRTDLDSWYKGLNSKGGGYCCIESEANGLADSAWESKDGHYRVFIFGEWRDVPPDAVLTVPNLAGRTLLWADKAWRGGVTIRCFMPGPMS